MPRSPGMGMGSRVFHMQFLFAKICFSMPRIFVGKIRKGHHSPSFFLGLNLAPIGGRQCWEWPRDLRFGIHPWGSSQDQGIWDPSLGTESTEKQQCLHSPLYFLINRNATRGEKNPQISEPGLPRQGEAAIPTFGFIMSG